MALIHKRVRLSPSNKQPLMRNWQQLKASLSTTHTYTRALTRPWPFLKLILAAHMPICDIYMLACVRVCKVWKYLLLAANGSPIKYWWVHWFVCQAISDVTKNLFVIQHLRLQAVTVVISQSRSKLTRLTKDATYLYITFFKPKIHKYL